MTAASSARPGRSSWTARVARRPDPTPSVTDGVYTPIEAREGTVARAGSDPGFCTSRNSSNPGRVVPSANVCVVAGVATPGAAVAAGANRPLVTYIDRSAATGADADTSTESDGSPGASSWAANV